MEWEVQYYPAFFPTCQSKEDLKKYIELQESVYNGEFEKEIGHCFGKKCQQNHTIVDLRMDMDKELVYEYLMKIAIENGYTLDNTTTLIFSKKNEMVFKNHVSRG